MVELGAVQSASVVSINDRWRIGGYQLPNSFKDLLIGKFNRNKYNNVTYSGPKKYSLLTNLRFQSYYLIK